MRNAKTTAIVVTYKSATTIAHAMTALRNCYEEGLLDCIVVDNASHDGTIEFVKKEHPWAKVLENSSNLGFGRGCNAGLTHVQTPYVLLMNPDAAIDPDSLNFMVDFMQEHHRVGIVGPAIIDGQSGVQVAGGLPTPWSIVGEAIGLGCPSKGQRPIVPGDAPFKTDWVCGAVLLIRKKLLDELKGFDPNFFLYFEETDLCRRALTEGSEIWALGQAVATHGTGASASVSQEQMYRGCIAEHFFRSRFYYFVKHHGLITAASAEISELVVMIALALPRWLLKRDRGQLRMRLRAPILSLPSVLFD